MERRNFIKKSLFCGSLGIGSILLKKNLNKNDNNRLDEIADIIYFYKLYKQSKNKKNFMKYKILCDNFEKKYGAYITSDNEYENNKKNAIFLSEIDNDSYEEIKNKKLNNTIIGYKKEIYEKYKTNIKTMYLYARDTKNIKSNLMKINLKKQT